MWVVSECCTSMCHMHLDADFILYNHNRLWNWLKVHVMSWKHQLNSLKSCSTYLPLETISTLDPLEAVHMDFDWAF